MTMITPSYLGETIEYSSLHACRSTLEDPTRDPPLGKADMGPDPPYESNSAAGYEPNSATGTEGLSRGTEGLSRGATEPREEFRRRREEKEER